MEAIAPVKNRPPLNTGMPIVTKGASTGPFDALDLLGVSLWGTSGMGLGALVATELYDHHTPKAACEAVATAVTLPERRKKLVRARSCTFDQKLGRERG